MTVSIPEGAAEQFARDGVVHIPGALPSPWLERIQELWAWSMANKGPLASPLIQGRDDGWQDLCNPASLAVYRDTLLASPVGELTAAVWGAPDVWFMYEQVFHKTAGGALRTPWHQDTSYLAVTGEHLMVMWITFEPMPKEKSLEFVKGSHRGPLYNTTRFDTQDPTAPIFDSELPRLPDIEANRAQFDVVSYATQPGDVVMFHPTMLHGGAPTDDANPERRTLTLRFFGEKAYFQKRSHPAGPFFQSLQETFVDGAPFRHPRFLKLC